MIRKTAKLPFALLMALVPRKYYPAMIAHLRKALGKERSAPSARGEAAQALLDYSKERIVMTNGIRKDSCAREPYTVEWIERSLKPGQVFYDIGANVGAYAIIAGKLLRGRGLVYAFEPAFHSFDLLVRNVLGNGLTEVVVPLNIPLSDTEGLLPFHYASLDAGAALHALGEAVDCRGQTFQPALTQPMLATTLDELHWRFGLPVPNHIKLDVDGLELAVLHGGERLLQESACESVLVEDAGRFETRDLCSFMEDCGFEAFERHEHPNDAYYHVFAKAR